MGDAAFHLLPLSRMPASVEHHPFQQVYALDFEAVAKDLSLIRAHGDSHSLVSCTPLHLAAS